MDDPVFPAKNLDMVIMRSVFHDLENPLSMLENIKKYIKPDSPLVIAEQRHTDFLPIHVITKEHLLSTVSRSSFKLIHIDESLPYRWVIYFFKVDKNKEQNVWKNWLNELHSEVKKIQEMEKDQSISLGKIRIAWERVFESFRDNNPQSEEDERIREYIKERIRSLKGFFAILCGCNRLKRYFRTHKMSYYERQRTFSKGYRYESLGCGFL